MLDQSIATTALLTGVQWVETDEIAAWTITIRTRIMGVIMGTAIEYGISEEGYRQEGIFRRCLCTFRLRCLVTFP